MSELALKERAEMLDRLKKNRHFKSSPDDVQYIILEIAGAGFDLGYGVGYADTHIQQPIILTQDLKVVS